VEKFRRQGVTALSWQEDDYQTLRELPEDEIRLWLAGSDARGRSPQWWNAMYDWLESALMRRRHRGEDLDVGLFRLVSVLLPLGRDSIGAGYTAQWLLKFAVEARRSGVPVSQLPDEMTPNGSVRGAVALIPLSVDEAVLLAHKQDRSFEETELLRDCGMIIASLEWGRDFVTDEDLRGELAQWFDAYERMG
jgi:hypothetical protein